MSETDTLIQSNVLDRIHASRMQIAGFVIGFAAATCVMISAVRASDEQPPALLKEQIAVTEDFITLGDLFENAGVAAKTAVFRSPDLGKQGVVRASRVKTAAKNNGLHWPNLADVKTIAIRRPSRLISIGQQKELIRETLALKLDLSNPDALDITFTSGAKPMHLHPKSKTDIIVKSLDYNKKSGQFKAVTGPSDQQDTAHNHIMRGRAFKTVGLLVPAVVITKGTPITREDLKISKVANYKVKEGVAQSEEQVIGLASKRRLQPGQPIQLSDLEQPRLVRKNSLVQIIFDQNGLAIKAEGRALEHGSLGDAVRVLNTHSKRTIHATVIGHGLLSVSRPKNTTLARRQRPARPQQPLQKNKKSWETSYRVR